MMQPHFFPWSGYFNLIFKSDKFVFLDDSQFVKSSWHSKNYIIINRKKNFLTVPTIKSNLKTTIKEKLVDQKNDWRANHAKTILQSYSKHKFIEDLNDLIDFFLNLEITNLSNLNIELIKFIAGKINIKKNFFYSSDLNIKEKRTKKIITILDKLKATEYVATEGSRDYLQDDDFEKITNIKLTFNNYNSERYNQKYQKFFINNLSIIDVIANLGWNNTEDYVKETNILKIYHER